MLVFLPSSLQTATNDHDGDKTVNSKSVGWEKCTRTGTTTFEVGITQKYNCGRTSFFIPSISIPSLIHLFQFTPKLHTNQPQLSTTIYPLHFDFPTYLPNFPFPI
ncbi:hypothetical protein Pcinc_022208 [Petrolisthes cinctipes]|uniref:Uncharacterized protein n=1 Tax=Petrolisthes cinctipes TaxID=88211 RepID=A0AAE1KHE8_PETCI|nr:hypothetical protein Pcinc_022208 [Petrolisthes cinctipes]